MTPSAFPLLPNYIPSNVYSYWVTCIDIWTLWNTRSRLQVLTHIDMYCLPIDPAAPAHIGQNRASQRHRNAYPICNQMPRTLSTLYPTPSLGTEKMLNNSV